MSLNLQESVRQWVLTNLPFDKSDADLVRLLNGLDAHGLLIRYHNWISRLIRPRPRTVHKSATFQLSFSRSTHQAAINQIVDDIEQGRDLKRYLSRGVDIAAEIPRNDIKFQKRRDLDLLLTSWEIHHLHLNTLVEADGFVTRTDDLLFAVFRENDAYLIDIVSHGGWYQENLLRILMNELPGTNVVQKIRGVSGLSPVPDEAKIKTLRNAGTNSAHMIDGKAVIALGGLTLAGTGINASFDADKLLARVESFEVTWEHEPETIKAAFAANDIIMTANPEFEFLMTPDGPGVLEKITKTFVPL